MNGIDLSRITPTDALDYMDKAVAAHGVDYLYPIHERRPNGLCGYAVYDEQDEPIAASCLIGHWLVAAGLPVADLARHEAITASEVLLRYGAPVWLAHAALDAQVEQDTRRTWGRAANTFARSLARERALS